jgi:hypothetical protein
MRPAVKFWILVVKIFSSFLSVRLRSWSETPIANAVPVFPKILGVAEKPRLEKKTDFGN